jgi:hypothetical protein
MLSYQCCHMQVLEAVGNLYILYVYVCMYIYAFSSNHFAYIMFKTQFCYI